jgi:2Fe-2S ferredoxin
MAKITFVQPDGIACTVSVSHGLSVMEAAIQNLVAGIDVECGVACSCATCRVDIDPAWADRAGRPGDMEAEMLSAVPDLRPTSRLFCQIKMIEVFDGLTVHVPQSQR